MSDIIDKELEKHGKVLLLQCISKNQADYDKVLVFREFMTGVIIGRAYKNFDWIDASGSRCAFTGLMDSMERRLKRIDKYQAQVDLYNNDKGTNYSFTLVLMDDPGLGLMLPADFKHLKKGK